MNDTVGKVEKVTGLPDTTGIFGDLDLKPWLPDTTSFFGNLDFATKLPDTTGIFGDLDLTPRLPDTTGILGDLDLTPRLPGTTGIFGDLDLKPWLPDTTSFFGNLDFATKLPDTTGIFGDLDLTPRLPDTTGILGDLDLTPRLPGTTGIFGDLDLKPWLPDTTSFFGNLDLATKLPDTTGIFGDLDLTPRLPDTTGILGDLDLTPRLPGTTGIFGDLDLATKLPDTTGIFGDLDLATKLPDTKSFFEGVKATPKPVEFREDLLDVPAALDSLVDGSEAEILTAHLESIPDSVKLPSHNQLLFRAEFDIRLNLAPIPRLIDSSETFSAPDQLHWLVFRELEQQLRGAIRDQLLGLVGTDWIKQRVPPDVRMQWHKRQDEDRAACRPVFEAIQYADFMDLQKVIVSKDNWRDVFRAIFQSSEDIIVSFNRLHPVRKALAHNRPLSKLDVLTLVSETSRVVSRLKSVWVWYGKRKLLK